MEAEEESRRRPRNLAIASFVFAAIAFFVAWYGHHWEGGRAAWKETTATITAARVDSDDKHDATIWFASFDYDFIAGGSVVHAHYRDFPSNEPAAHEMVR